MTSLSRLGAAQMAGAKYLGKSLKKMNEIEKKQAELEAKLIEGQKALVEGTANAMIAGADAQAEATKSQAVGQIVGGTVGVLGTTASVGVTRYGANKYSMDEADLNQQMADELNKPIESIKSEARSQNAATTEDSAPKAPQLEAQARLKELFGEATKNPEVLSKDAEHLGILKGKKLSQKNKNLAANIQDPKVREEMAAKYADRAKAQRAKVESQRKPLSEAVATLNAFSQAASSLLSASFSAQSANSQTNQGEQRAIETQFQGAEQARKAASDAAHTQTQSDMQLIKDQVEAMRRIASPN